MKEIDIYSAGLSQVRGGLTFNEIWSIVKAVAKVADIVMEYADDFINGFKDGYYGEE